MKKYCITEEKDANCYAKHAPKLSLPVMFLY